jgi:ribosomal RNA-processing protein 8
MPPPVSKLQAQMRERLAGGQFRYINELLYTQTGRESFAMMQRDPSMFDAYHSGFRSQTTGWPQNPLDVMLAEIRRGAPRGGATIADFGCGDARLAATLTAKQQQPASSSSSSSSAPLAKPFTVHSFDLVAPPGNKFIMACDMARVPLPAASVDVAVFCLSLMGTDYLAFLAEGARVLRPGGRLLIAEVRSRFETAAPAAEGAGAGGAPQQPQHKGGKPGHHQQQKQQQQAGKKRPRDDEVAGGSGDGAAMTSTTSGVNAFVAAVARLGFALDKRDERNTMFVTLFFTKNKPLSPQPSSAAEGAGAASSKVDQHKGGKPHGQQQQHKPAAAPSTAPAPQAAPAPGAAAAAAAADAAAPGGDGQPAKKKRRHKRKKRAADAAAAAADAEGGGGGSGRDDDGGAMPALHAASAAAPDGAAPALKACVYKKR